jgi:uroporphyrin-III C-methyltransferase/precorrin-2 dehydrogenase/sirohydrochlorin ferrochelatase
MGTQRVRQLAEAGARVTVVAPEILPEAASLAAEIRRRPFAPADLDGVWLAVAAAPPEVNRAVAEAAEARRILVNAVDDPARATAYFPGVVRRGGATVAISTDGRAPALAGLLREGLAALLPEDLEAWLETAEGLRAGWKALGVPLGERRPLLLQRLNALYAAASPSEDGPAPAPGEADPASSA